MARRGAIAALIGAVLVACSTSSGVTTVQVDRIDRGPTPVSTAPTPSTPSTGTDPSTEPPPNGDPGSPDGLGDTLFPELGNPGYDVLDYDVELAYDSIADTIEGAVTITMLPLEQREQFTLDSAGPDVDTVTVDGEKATFVEEDVELRITPATPLEARGPVVVVVRYTAAPDSGPSAAAIPNGWFHTAGGSYVLNEPDGARTWLPSNDHPSDKATWTFRITVPDGVTAVANGALVSHDSSGGTTTWVWREGVPMSTYLVQLLTGDYEIVEGVGPDGLPLLSAVLREDRTRMQPFFDTIGTQIDFFDDFFGPYPLDRYGLAFTDSFAGLAMETQGRSLFSRDDFATGRLGLVEQLLLSHELVHQWFGNAVSPGEWQDIWLNESFATYGQWMWFEEVGLSTVADEAETALQTKVVSGGDPTGSPDAESLFDFNSYDGGAVVLEALRRTVGDETFFAILRTWVEGNTGQSRRTEDFIDHASEVAGDDLIEFFDEWLFAARSPTEFPHPAA